MRVAVYARRSTEEHQGASLDTQRASAEIFARDKRWSIVATFVDSGISGSEFVERPGLAALKRFCVQGECDVVLVRALDRIGRDTLRAVEFVRDLAELPAPVQVWAYATGAQVKVDDPVSIFSAMAVSLAGDIEARALRSRITEGLRRRAEKGLCVGGDVYGYARERTPEGVRYVPHHDEVAIVREVFRRRAAGESLRALVHDLNRRGVPSPSAGTRGTGSWSPSVLHEMLHRERYLGVLVWGRHGSEYKGGTRKALVRGDHEVTRVERPDLALIDRATWDRVRALDAPTRGRTGTPSRHLLIGFVRCAACGGPLGTTRTREGAVSVHAYACAWALTRGPTVCTVRLRRPVARLDAGVLDWMRQEALDPVVNRLVLEELRGEFEARATAPDTRREDLAQEIARVTREKERLARSLALLDDEAAAADVVRELKARAGRLTTLRHEFDALPATQGTLAAWSEIERDVTARLADLRGCLQRGVTGAREVLAALLAGSHLTAEVEGEGRSRAWSLVGAAFLPPRGLFASLEGTDQTPRQAVPLPARIRQEAA